MENQRPGNLEVDVLRRRPPVRQSRRWIAVVFGAAIALVALVVRLWAASDELWLDEIWSLARAEDLRSPLQIVTGIYHDGDYYPGIHHDNNHYLNTLFLYLLGDRAGWLWYRAPNIVAGLGAVLLACRIGARGGQLESLIAMLLTACSFLLIQYSSEARGYGLAIFFQFLAFDRLYTYLDSRSRAALFGYWAAAVLAVLSHLTSVFVVAALAVWSIVHLWRKTRRGLVKETILCHAVPACAVAVLCVLDVRYIRIGRGPPFEIAEVVTSAASLALGGPQEGALATAIAGMALALGMAALVLLWRENADLWVFYLTTIALMPAFGLVVHRPETLFVRYFLPAIAFYLLMLSRLVAHLLSRGRFARAAAVLGLAAFVAGNAWSTASLLRYGRGHYREAVVFMADNTAGSVIHVGSDHDFRNRLVLQYYSRFLPPGKRIAYEPRDTWPRGGPEWLIQHSQDQSRRPPLLIKEQGNDYRLQRQYPYGGLSGWRWFIYKNNHAPDARST